MENFIFCAVQLQRLRYSQAVLHIAWFVDLRTFYKCFRQLFIFCEVRSKPLRGKNSLT